MRTAHDETPILHDDGPETIARSVGREIRAVRKARRLTLKALSERTGRSIAYLSRIERGGARASVELLADIGEALNVDPRWLFPTRSGRSFNERTYVVRAAARRSLSDLYTRDVGDLGFVDELLSSSIAGDLYMMISRFPPGAQNAPHPRRGYSYEGEQHGVIIEGEIELTLDDDVIMLKAGDSFSYATQLPHLMRNVGEAEAVMISAMTPVRISW